MSHEAEVLVGVVDRKVNAKIRWKVSGRFEDIVFDPNNAYQIGTALKNAACDAAGTTPLMMGETKKMKITLEQRARMLVISGKIIRSMMEQGKKAENIATHVVDLILQETTE